VEKKSLERIFENISSKIKKKKYIPEAYHTFISDIKNEHIFEEIFDFLDKN
jgi:alpha-beta hydrolase superfamily lysophospholipase